MLQIQKRALQAIDGIEITTAQNGLEALDAFDAGKFDLILSDWNMPAMTGIEFLEAVRIRDSKIPFIMITTECQKGQVVEAIAAGVTDYLVKPFTSDALIEKVSRFVGSKV